MFMDADQKLSHLQNPGIWVSRGDVVVRPGVTLNIWCYKYDVVSVHAQFRTQESPRLQESLGVPRPGHLEKEYAPPEPDSFQRSCS